ncbi:putative glycoside hydrolase [Halocella sp. SP3-1]|uniref:putative glycoside hydrolase n=1 Tax=Halocella sp. SP3-1 TaxID=2382161 RepID=UPI000F75B67A|nr:putative glycoside hydrolase [Halocella sp. SP3-1]AZO96579.1 GTP-binding protein [Halocella sp. SP3-1]
MTIKNITKLINTFVIILLILLLYPTQLLADFRLHYNLDRPPAKNSKVYQLVDEKKLYLPEFYVKGIYVTGWVAGSEKISALINLVDKTVLNTMVIDIKDQLGHLSYKSNVPLAQEIGANRRKIKNIKALIDELHSRGIYVIGRIVVFKDALLANKRKDLSLKLEQSDNTIIKSDNWVDPSQKEIWDYNLALAREAVEIGFDEIQFDYIRYPALARKPYQAVVDKENKSQYINSFAQYVRDELDLLNTPVSIDVFGLTTAVNDDLGIGQNFKELSNIVQIISPMVYPSHYSAGSYGIPVPDREPYQIIYKSLIDAQEKISDNSNVVIRPWLQDFSLGYKYSLKDVQEQIKAVEKLGLTEWLLWNPSSKYTIETLLTHP